MSFSNWDTQREQFEFYLTENYLFLDRRKGRALIACAISGLALAFAGVCVAVFAVFSGHGKSDVAAEYLAALDTLQRDVTALESRYTEQTERAGQLAATLAEIGDRPVASAAAPGATQAEIVSTADLDALRKDLDALRADTRQTERAIKAQLAKGKFDKIITQELVVKRNRGNEYIRMATYQDAAVLELNAQNRAAVLRAKKDTHALLDFNSLTDGWLPVVHVGTDSNEDGSIVSGLVSLDERGRNRLRAVYDSETQAPIVDLVDSNGYSKLVAKLSDDQPELDLFDANRVRVETGVFEDGAFGMAVYDPDGTISDERRNAQP